MQIKENTSIHPGKISLGVGRYVDVVTVVSYLHDYYYSYKVLYRQKLNF